MQMIPPLKQKTGIIKSKVPPPVPPRGSPHVDRRTSASGGSHKSAGPSPRGTTSSSGEQNYLNDKYFKTIQPNPNNVCRLSPQMLYKKTNERVPSPSRAPIFRDRSPTCVQDWLEINDFTASDYDESALQFTIIDPQKSVTIEPRKPVPFRTAHLQRQSSFRAISRDNDTSVRRKVEKYSEYNEKLANQKMQTVNNGSINNNNNNDTANISANIVSDRIKAYDYNQNSIFGDKKKDLNNTSDQRLATVTQHKSVAIETNVKKGKIDNLRKTFENVTSCSMVPQQQLQSQPSTLPLLLSSNPPSIKPRTKFNTKTTTLDNLASALNDTKSVISTSSDNILNILKRKQPSTVDRPVIDESDNVKKHEILKTHSKIHSVENVQNLDAFSLEGEFV